MTTKKLSTQPQEGIDLRRWRESHNVKQSELAKRAGLSGNLLCLLEAGKRNFTKDSSDKIYRAVKELNAERAERLTAIALNQDSQGVAFDEILTDKKAPARELKRALLLQREQLQALRAQLQAYQQKERRELAPLQEAWMERNVKPLTEQITKQEAEHKAEIAELKSQLADMHRLVALKADAVGKEAQAQDLQEQIEQRVKRSEQS
jgi:transcriptional regulator with XRE-family HTH domain